MSTNSLEIGRVKKAHTRVRSDQRNGRHTRKSGSLKPEPFSREEVGSSGFSCQRVRPNKDKKESVIWIFKNAKTKTKTKAVSVVLKGRLQ